MGCDAESGRVHSGRVTECWLGVGCVILSWQRWRLGSPVQADSGPESLGRVSVSLSLGVLLWFFLFWAMLSLQRRRVNDSKSGGNRTKTSSVKERGETACVVRSEHQVAIKRRGSVVLL